jgi:hypothetical protein
MFKILTKKKGCERLKIIFRRRLNKRNSHRSFEQKMSRKAADTCVNRTDSHTNFTVLQHATSYARIASMTCAFSPQELCWLKGLDSDRLREYYRLVNKVNLVHNLFLVYLYPSMFINLYVFQASMCPSSEETTVFMGCEWLSGMHTRQSSTQNNKYEVSHEHCCFSWWWAHSRPKHVEIDKHTKK